MKYSNIHQGLAFSHMYPSYGISTNGSELPSNTIHPLSYPTTGHLYPTSTERNWPDVSALELTTQSDVQLTQLAPLPHLTSLARAELGICARPTFALSESIQLSPTSLTQAQLELSTISTVPALAQIGAIQPTAHDKLAKEFFHPFYCRRRNNHSPVEGMTRTRDKYRVVYSEKQRAGLEKEFKDKKFITSKRKAELAEKLDLSERQVKIWFQNRRAKERRQTKSRDDSPCDDEDGMRSNTHTVDLRQRPSCLYSSQDRYIPSSSTSLTAADCRYQQHTPGEFVKTYHQQDEQTVPQFPMSPSDWVSSPNNSVLTSFDISPFGTSSATGQCQRI